MKKKINSRFMLVSALAIIVTAVSAMFLYYNILKDQIFADLKAYAHIIEQMSMDQLNEDIAKLDKDGKLPEKASGEKTVYNPWEDELRITLVNPDGKVFYETLANKDTMENHKSRPEIEAAFKEGEGTAIRWSSTVSMHTFYYATKLKDGNVLRIAKDSDSITTIMKNTVIVVALISLLVFLVCIWISRYLTDKLVEPVEKLAANIILVDEQNVYEEIRPFISTIKEQHMNILNIDRMRQEFTANVSHELKTPLTAISGYAELIGNGMAGEADTERFANEIHRNADRLLTLINDIIKLSELDSTEAHIEYEPVDLYEAAANCMGILEMQASKQEVTISLKGEPTTINSNKTLIDELLFNLCSNAVRYNKRGGSVTIIVTTKQGRAYLAVEDTGIGIPKEHQQRVFERFYRVDKSRSKLTGGTGLGLAIVKHIVAQHDAQLILTSEEGQGTKIEVLFAKSN